MASLQTVLAENGLGKYADIFAAEEIFSLDRLVGRSS